MSIGDDDHLPSSSSSAPLLPTLHDKKNKLKVVNNADGGRETGMLETSKCTFVVYETMNKIK